MSRFGKFLHRLFDRDSHHSGGGATGTQNGTTQTNAPQFGQLQFALAQMDAAEGVKGSTVVLYIGIQRTAGKDQPVGVSVQAIDGTAIHNIDYQLITSTAAWINQDAVTKTVIVDILPRLASGNFSFQLKLVSPTGGASLGVTTTMTIMIKRSGFGEADFSGIAWGVQTPAVTSTLNLTVQRNIAAKGAVGVSWHTTDGSAISGTDYTGGSGTLSWADGDSLFKTISVTILHRAPNPNRSFTVTIDTPTGGILIGGSNVATVTISDAAPGPNPTVTSSIPNQIVDTYEGREIEQLIGDDASYSNVSILLNSYGSSVNQTRINAIFAVNANTIFAVGNGGLVLVSTNGGASWTVLPTGVTANLFGVFFTSATTGWVVGANGTILFTSNGGATWTPQVSGTSQQLNSISMVSATTGFIVGTNGVILATTNGGATWTAQTSGTALNLNSVSAVNANDAWAVGQNGTILVTTNGGATWTAQTSGTTQNLTGVSFVSTTTGWAVGSNGTILVTTNGGATWTAQTSGTTDGLNSISMVSTTTGFAVGVNGTILSTTNGGTTWTSQTSGTTQNLTGVSTVSGTTAFVQGTNNIFSTTNSGTTWTSVDSITAISGPGPAGTTNGGATDFTTGNSPSFSPQLLIRFQGHHN